MARLRRSDLAGPGIVRRRRGKGFSYIWTTDERVTDRATLDRIRALAIPPAWRDVWICPWPHGHIQAVGTDAAGRRQYRYHDNWRKRRDHEKFERVVEFGRHLPSLRAAVTVDLAKSGLGKRRVVATAVRLLDIGLFRVGGEEYADEHETFGIATLRKEHVSLHDGQLVFEYPAKGSVARMVAVRDQEAATVVRRLRNRRGGSDCLLAWKDKGGWHDVRSTDINAYIKAEMGQDFSAKDFRTWSATVLAACTLAAMTEERRDRRMTSKAVAAATKEVAESLGNTPAVCRSSYIDPRIIDHFAAGETITRRPNPTDITLNQLSRRSVIEAEVLDLLSADDSAAAS